jgi:hypothetical protein
MRLFTSAAEPAQVPPSEIKHAITRTKPTATLSGDPRGDAISPPFFLSGTRFTCDAQHMHTRRLIGQLTNYVFNELGGNNGAGGSGSRIQEACGNEGSHCS